MKKTIILSCILLLYGLISSDVMQAQETAQEQAERKAVEIQECDLSPSNRSQMAAFNARQGNIGAKMTHLAGTGKQMNVINVSEEQLQKLSKEDQEFYQNIPYLKMKYMAKKAVGMADAQEWEVLKERQQAIENQLINQ